MSDGEQQPAPWDPAGTRPKHDPESLLPATSEPLLPPDAEVVDTTAEDENGSDLLPERRRAAGLGEVAPAAHSTYAPRFQFMTGALVAIGVAALVGIAVFVILPSTKTPGPPWSPWSPSTGGLQGAAQIAEHVAPKYRDSGQQLVRIEANDLSVNGVPLAVELQTTQSQGGNIQVHDEKGVMYQLCGVGVTSCSISQGKASPQRMLLLRREGLELALYTFRYIKGVDQIVVLIPPLKGKAQTVALYFRREQVEDELSQPLTTSLLATAPTVQTVTLSPDRPLVDRKAASQYLFTFDGSSINSRAYLVLMPYTPDGDAQLQAQFKARQQQQAAATGG
jgi:hypothetical protein